MGRYKFWTIGETNTDVFKHESKNVYMFKDGNNWLVSIIVSIISGLSNNRCIVTSTKSKNHTIDYIIINCRLVVPLQNTRDVLKRQLILEIQTVQKSYARTNLSAGKILGNTRMMMITTNGKSMKL